MSNGWIKLYRCTLDNPIVMKDGDYLAVWCYLLMMATHKEYSTLFGKKRIVLQPGQLITGCRYISSILGINYHKIHRILNDFKSDTQIETHGTRNGTLISIVNWDKYQNDETHNETNVRQKRDTRETHVRHKQEDKEQKNVRNNNPPLSPQGEKKPSITSLIDERGFSAEVKEIILEWVKYKSEKKQGYKETGFKKFLTEVHNNIMRYGDESVIEAFNFSMSMNYQGVFFDRCKENKPKQEETTQLDRLMDMIVTEREKENDEIRGFNNSDTD